MLTALGKFCRMLRIKHDEVLRDMAQRLGVSSSYLSAVENGKRPTPQGWRDELIRLYSLTDDESKELDNVIYLSQQEVKLNLNLNRFSNSDRDALLTFARRYDSLDEDTKVSLSDLFKERE